MKWKSLLLLAAVILFSNTNYSFAESVLLQKGHNVSVIAIDREAIKNKTQSFSVVDKTAVKTKEDKTKLAKKQSSKKYA